MRVPSDVLAGWLVAGVDPALVRAAALGGSTDLGEVARFVPRDGFELLSIWDDFYPDSWKALEHPPAVVAVAGDCSVLSRPGVAVVGGQDTGEFSSIVATLAASAAKTAGVGVITDGENQAGLAAVEVAVEDRAPLVLVPRTEPHADVVDLVVKSGCVVSFIKPESPMNAGRLLLTRATCLVVAAAAVPSRELELAKLAQELGLPVVVPRTTGTRRGAAGLKLLASLGSSREAWANDLASERSLLRVGDNSVAHCVSADREHLSLAVSTYSWFAT